MPRKPARPSDATLLKESEEAGRIARAAPNGRDVARSLGPFKTCDVPTLIEDDRGEFQVNVTDERATREENRHRWGLVNEALEEKRRLEVDAGHRRSAERETITIHDARTGEVREIRADREDQIARKKWARPGSRSRKYFFMGH